MAVEMTRTGSKGVDKLTRSEIDQKIMRQLWLKKKLHIKVQTLLKYIILMIRGPVIDTWIRHIDTHLRLWT